jgi:LPS sulfotransferase NodH
MNYIKSNNEIFFVLTEQRSGSTWFMTLLNNHPQISAFGELFLNRPRHTTRTPKFGDIWNGDKLETQRYWEYSQHTKLFRPFSTLKYLYNLKKISSINSQFIAIKLMQSQLKTFPELYLYLIAKRCKVILLFRKNVVEKLLSQKTMHYFNITHTTNHQNLPKMYIDPLQFLQDLYKIKKNQKKLYHLAKYAFVEFTTVYYEELKSNTQYTLNSIYDFLNLAPCNDFNSSLVKINTKKIGERIKNIDEIRDVLSGTEFDSFI